ncbi:MAG: hypothetical protein HY325_01350 [Chloroflexi bacterium]|nr:hypothetical protein [Chloroflexota bacterium]
MNVIDKKFRDWTKGKSPQEARIDIYQRIRDIPYAVIPELTGPQNYADILKVNQGSCTPKHFLLGDMYQKLGILILYAVYTFRWDELEVDYPPRLKNLAKGLPVSHHLACKADIEGKLVLLDATLDLALGTLGLPVNRDWDGLSDTLLPIEPLDEEIYHPSEAKLMSPLFDEKSLAFYQELNLWLEKVRKG